MYRLFTSSSFTTLWPHSFGVIYPHLPSLSLTILTLNSFNSLERNEQDQELSVMSKDISV